MKMVAAAKLRKAQEFIFATRPYAFKVREIINHLHGKIDPGSHELFQHREEYESVLLVVVSGERGLAGAFNTNVFKVVESTVADRFAREQETGKLYLMCVGRKGQEYFARREYDIVSDHTGEFNNLSFGGAVAIVNEILEGSRSGRWDRVFVIYNEFKNTISQNRIVEPFLPIPEEEFMTPVMEGSEDYHDTAEDPRDIDYIFEPDPQTLLNELVPRYLNYQLWRILLESNAAEQGARMVAMDNATTNAGELLRELKLNYNQARQEAITSEILEIASGAEALVQSEQ
jgi:F-type H+-transporting ATPase subunit gamma